MKVYQAINKVQADLASQGISKDRKNQQQGYSFRGIDDMYNVVSPLLAKHGLCILPRVLSRNCEERTNSKGTTLFYTTVDAEFDFVSAEDGSKHTVKTFGEAMDSGDKSTNKAQSAAFKYAVMQAFAIPTEGDNDADSQSHEVQSHQIQRQQQRQAPKPAASQDAQDLAVGIIDAWNCKDEPAVMRLINDVAQADKPAVWGLLATTQGLQQFITESKKGK